MMKCIGVYKYISRRHRKDIIHNVCTILKYEKRQEVRFVLNAILCSQFDKDVVNSSSAMQDSDEYSSRVVENLKIQSRIMESLNFMLVTTSSYSEEDEDTTGKWIDRYGMTGLRAVSNAIRIAQGSQIHSTAYQVILKMLRKIEVDEQFGRDMVHNLCRSIEFSVEVNDKKSSRGILKCICMVLFNANIKMENTENLKRAILKIKNMYGEDFDRDCRKKVFCVRPSHVEEECNICLEHNDGLLQTRCRHIFDYKCLRKWFRTKEGTSCPTCRNEGYDPLLQILGEDGLKGVFTKKHMTEEDFLIYGVN